LCSLTVMQCAPTGETFITLHIAIDKLVVQMHSIRQFC
jgi:hypothetical protein